MATVNVHEAKTHLSRLLAQVEAGEEVDHRSQRQAGGPARGVQATGQEEIRLHEGPDQA